MVNGKVFIGCDHAGFELKEELKKFLQGIGYECEDMGDLAYDKDDDYPDYASKVCEEVVRTNGGGILICGTGLGMDRAANKVPGIYASVCWDEKTARQAREHGDTNILALGALNVSVDAAKRIAKTWLETPFSKEQRHVRRVEKVKEIERRYARQ